MLKTTCLSLGLAILLIGCGGSSPESLLTPIEELDAMVEGGDAAEDVLESSPEAGSDSKPDSEPDVKPDAEPETGPEVSPEAAPDSEPDAAPICTPDDVRCDGLDATTCNTDGTEWEVTETCPYLCDEGACTGECLPGSAQCDGIGIQTCNTEGQWTSMVTCPYACWEGACVGACVPDTKKCDGLTPQICSPMGQWKDLTDCPVLCTAGECVTGCTPGESLCNGLEVQTCNTNHTWDVTETCPYVCNGGACTGVCTPGVTRCSGSAVEVCNNMGQWTLGSTCPAACLGGSCVACSPGSSRCSGNTIETCNAQGSWVTGQTCSVQCMNGACLSCTPGERVCDGAGYKQCDASGAWSLTVPCVGDVNASPTCSGAGVCGWGCNPGFEDCTGGAGCETNLSDPSTCGSCTNDCDGTNGTPTCTSGTCGIVCDSGWANCGSGAGCETPLGTLTNCMACGDSCGAATAPNASMACEAAGCALSCDQTWGDCDGNPANGCEHDVWNDPKNCGACGNDCYGGTCTAGVCSQDLELVAEAQGMVSGILVNGSYVYWSVTGTPGRLYRAPKTGGATELLGTDPDNGNATLMGTNGTDLVYYDGFNRSIKKLPVGGGVVTTLTTGYMTVQVVTDDTYAYWNDQDNNIPCYCSTPDPTHVYRVPIAGGSVELLATFTLGARYFLAIVDSARLVIANDGPYYPLPVNRHYGSPHFILKTNLGATYSTPQPFGTVTIGGIDRNMTDFGRFSANNDYLFFWAETTGGSALIRMEKSGSFSRMYMGNIGGSSVVWRPDAFHVYYQQSPYVRRISVNGGSPQVVAEGQYDGNSKIDIDDTHAYWYTRKFASTDPDLHVIMRTQK